MTTHTPSPGRTLTASQQRALARMPDVQDSRFPTDFRATVAASTYTDPARFDAEVETIWRREPVVIAPSAALPEPGSYMRTEMLGVPIVLTRTAVGEAKAFVNVCRHRGALVCTTDGVQRGNRLSCPYHAWMYGLDGALIAVPRHETFPGLDKAAHGLTPLPCREAGGTIWIGLDPKQTPDFTDATGPWADDLDALGLGGMRVFDTALFEIRANWKLVMDTMLDSYHVTRLHKDSLARFFVDAENIIDMFGPHIRALAARGDYTRAAPQSTFEEARQIMVFAYNPFPNGVIVCSPDFVSFAVFHPGGVRRTDVRYYMLVDPGERTEKGERKLRRSFDLMAQAFGREDYWAAELCHDGLAAGTLDTVILGGMEVQMARFHDVVNQKLGLGT